MSDWLRIDHPAESAHKKSPSLEVNEPHHAESSDVEVNHEIGDTE